MKISDFLSSENVFIDLRASNKRLLLQEMAGKAALWLKLSLDEIFPELLKREDLGSTGMGGGVAIPHARLQAINRPFGMLAKLRTPIDFAAIDGQPVDIVFLLLLPATAEAGQLDALASVARKIRTSEDLAQLRRAGSAVELYSAIVR